MIGYLGRCIADRQLRLDISNGPDLRKADEETECGARSVNESGVKAAHDCCVASEDIYVCERDRRKSGGCESGIKDGGGGGVLCASCIAAQEVSKTSQELA